MTGSSRDIQDAERRLIDLSDLLEISQTLNQSLELEAILNHLLLASMGRFAISRGLFLLGNGDETFRVAVAKGLSDLPPGTEIALAAPAEAIELDAEDASYAELTKRRLAIAFPLWRGGSCAGILALGGKLTRKPFEPAEIDFLGSLASVAAPAIENSRVYGELQHLNARLDRKIHELNTLFELSRRFVGTLDAEAVLQLFSYALMGQLALTRFLIVIQRPNGREIVHARGIPVDEPERWRDETFWELLSSIEEPLKIDAGSRGPFAKVGLTAVVPIRREAETYGFVGLGARPSKQSYTDEELAFANALANQAIIALVNAWLVEEAIESRRLEEELAIAKSIQERLFPKRIPEANGYEIAAHSTPTRHIGGDYYDAIALDDGRLLLAIADVSGKGVPAALLMSNVQATLRALASSEIDLAASASRINEIIYANTDLNKYATFFYGILDPKRNTLVYTNAGHNPPILQRVGGDVETLETGGLPVGLMPGSGYEVGVVEIEEGDVLALYTDGVTEAENTEGEEYGPERLESLVREGASESALGLLERIVGDVARFAAGMPQGDDITAMVVKRLASA
jgi:sigma-B regulation protein RsbU (phosphoserine phosphatase)